MWLFARAFVYEGVESLGMRARVYVRRKERRREGEKEKRKK